jgi:prophage regulatory protein
MTYDMSDDLATDQASSVAENELWRLSKVCKFVGLSKSTIYQMIKREQFPVPVKTGARAVAWHSEQIKIWIKTRPLSM